VRLRAGREERALDPHTGEARPLASGWHAFFQLMNDWHRALGRSGEGRPIGRAITGAANACLLVLALSGLYLWWPRRASRPSIWFRRGLTGKARDWSWHNVIGFWSLPVLLVVTASGLTISYRWATNLVYAVAREPAPAERAARARGTVAVSVKSAGAWPPFASVQLTLDGGGRTLRTERFEDQSPARKARSWLRFLHTGEALGWPGQLVVGTVSLALPLMVWTGLALAWRRFLRRQRR
jgi:uncharacterized iron-regulated membrane protein